MSTCSSCGEPLDALAFPGAKIRCGKCGAENVAGAGVDAKPAPVYRAPAPREAAPATPEAASSAGAARKCPRCGVALVSAADRHSCGRCNGDFVDHVGVRRMLALADARRTGESFRRRKRFDPDTRSFPCPVCREQMERSAFGATSGIYLDACDDHGIWFDARELDDAMAYVSAVGLDVAMAPLPEPKAPPVAPRASPSLPLPKSSVADPAVLRAGLDATLAYELAKDEAALGGARRRARGTVNLIGFVMRLFG